MLVVIFFVGVLTYKNALAIYSANAFLFAETEQKVNFTQGKHRATEQKVDRMKSGTEQKVEA